MTMKPKCYTCNCKLEEGAQEVVNINQVAKDSKDTPLIMSDTIASFCAQCLWDNCDDKLHKFNDRYTAKCLYCDDKVDTNSRHFYLSWERSFDVINSQLIHGKCYNANIAIYQKTKDRIKENWGTTWTSPVFGNPIFSPVLTGPIKYNFKFDVGLLPPSAPDQLIVSPKIESKIKKLTKKWLKK